MKHREWSPKVQTTFVCFNTILSVIPSGQYMCLVIMKKESFVQNRDIAFLPSIIVLSVQFVTIKVKNSTLSREEIKNENQPNKNPVSAHSSQRKELYPS